MLHSDLAGLAYIIMCTILNLADVMNESYSLSFCFLYLFLFYLLLKKHHHLRCGPKQWILVQLHLLMGKKKKPLVPSVVCIPSRLRLSLIGLKE